MSALIEIKGILAEGLHSLAILLPDFPVYIFLIIFLFGVYEAFLKGSGGYYLELIEDYINAPNEEDRYFLRLGLSMTANKYTLMLYMVGFAVFLIFGISAAASGSIKSLFLGLMIVALMILLLRPKAYLYKNIASPFLVLTDIISRRRKEELDRELYNSITTLKNLAIAQEDDAISADLMIEKLMDNSKKLKPIFAQTLSIYRGGDKTSALNFFGDSIGTKNGKSFAMTLEKIDKIEPSELTTQVLSLQEIMAEERFTKGLEKAENKGTIVYALATGVCFVCLLNFLFVCVVMDTLSSIGSIF